MKSVFAVVLVCVMLTGACITAFALDSATYTVNLPEGFSLVDTRDGADVYANDDVVISVGVSINASENKVNPSDADDAYMQSFKSQVEHSVKDGYSSVEIVRSDVAFAELGVYDAIRSYVECKYFAFDSSFIMCYQVCYLFETENYIHVLTVASDADITEFADELVKSFVIFDEPVKVAGFFSRFFDSVYGSIVVGAGIGVVVGIVLMLINKGKFTAKVTEALDEIDEEVPEIADEEASDNNSQPTQGEE